MTALILLLVFLSGFTGLIYQVIWQKYLSAYLGSHALATSQVLACFFLFMALGYFIIGRYQHKLFKNKVFLYGVIEGVIGLYALISPDLFHVLTSSYSFYGESGLADLFKSMLLTGLFLGLPTFLMGGTIPVLTQGLVRTYQKSHKVHSWIYATNTIGAFLGVIMGGFYFIENHGLPMSLLIVGLFNVGIFIACYILWKIKPNGFLGLPEEKTQSLEKPEVFLSNQHKWSLYSISFLSGFYVFSLETIIIKMAGLSLGSSTYTYSIVVSAFIFAIALGSSLVSLFKKIESVNLLYKIQFFLILFLIALYFVIPHWPLILGRINLLISKNMFNYHLKWFFVLFVLTLILLIPVGLMGTNLPLLFSYLKQKNQYLSKTVGRLYGINSIGGFLGALFGGYYLLMWVSLDTAMKLYIVLVASTLILTSILFDKKRMVKLISFSVTVFSISVLATWLMPSWSTLKFTPGVFLSTPHFLKHTSYSEWFTSVRKSIEESYDILHSQSGPNTWAVVLEEKKSKERLLYVNGKPDASTQGDFSVRAMNMLIPLSLKPQVEDVFVVGLGASLSTGIASKFNEVKTVEVAEISQGVINSMPYFNKHSFDVLDRKDKFQLFHVDAFRKLKSSKKRYDLIVSEPSNLWVSGVELLFSLEFLQEAQKHLKDDGLYSQWFPLFESNEEMFRMILANFNSVFPTVTVWLTSPFTVNIVASNKRIQISDSDLQRKFTDQQEIYKKYGFNHYQSILGLQALPEGTARGLVMDVNTFHTIEWPRLESMANKNGFVGSNVDLNNFLLTKMIKPLPTQEKPYQLLYEEYLPSLAEEFFIDNIHRFDAFKTFAHNFQRRRLIYLYQKYYDKPKINLDNSIKQIINYLVNGKNSIDLNLEKGLNNLYNQVEVYKSAITMHLPVKTQNLIALLPDQCQNVENCYKAKKIIHSLLKNKSVLEIEVKIDERKQIEKDFADLKSQRKQESVSL